MVLIRSVAFVHTSCVGVRGLSLGSWEPDDHDSVAGPKSQGSRIAAVGLGIT